MHNITVRFAEESDAAEILDIYTYYIEHTAVSFEETAPTVPEFAARIANTSAKFPYIVLVVDGVVRAYAYASPYRARAAYRFGAELSVYIAHSYQSRGIGKALYSALFEMLYAMNYYNLYAGITQPNEPSMKLHESMGFVPAGTWHNTGYKHGRWHDVKLLQKVLRSHDTPTSEPIPINELSEDIKASALKTCVGAIEESVNKAQ